MPLFGVNDLLFTLASKSALLWSKRSNVRQLGLHGVPSQLAPDAAGAAQQLARPRCSHRGAPILLLRKLDVKRGNRADGSPLVRSGVAVGYLPCTTPALPNVPHRHYNRHKIYPHVSTMVQCDEDEVARRVGSYKRAEVQTLFDTMEREGLWQAVVRVSRGIEVAGLRLTYLTQINVEVGLRTLLRHAPQQLAVGYYFAYSEDMLLSDDILVALFDACRHHERASIDLYNNLRPFQSRWTAAAFACCLTITAHYLPDEAFRLYDHFRSTQRGADKANDVVVVKSAVLDVKPTKKPLQYLYHIVVPLVLQHRPWQAARYVQDMLHHDPEAAPDVFLKCLCTPDGLQLATDYVRQLRDVDAHSAGVTAPYTIPLERASSRCKVAFTLYHCKPSAMNMNSLLEIILHELRHSPNVTACVDGSALGKLLRKLPVLSDVDTNILARTLAEHDAPLPLVECFLTNMLARCAFGVVPALAGQAMRHGGYALAARAMTVYLSNQRGVLTEGDLELCVEASVRAGRWSSALFWLERARGRLGSSAATSSSKPAAASVVSSAAGMSCSEPASSRVTAKTSRTSGAVDDVASRLAALPPNPSALR